MIASEFQTCSKFSFGSQTGSSIDFKNVTSHKWCTTLYPHILFHASGPQRLRSQGDLQPSSERCTTIVRPFASVVRPTLCAPEFWDSADGLDKCSVKHVPCDHFCDHLLNTLDRTTFWSHLFAINCERGLSLVNGCHQKLNKKLFYTSLNSQ